MTTTERVRKHRRSGWSVWKISQKLDLPHEEVRSYLYPEPKNSTPSVRFPKRMCRGCDGEARQGRRYCGKCQKAKVSA